MIELIIFIANKIRPLLKREFRIYCEGDKCYPQTRLKSKLLKTGWSRIYKYDDSFFQSDDLCHSKTELECRLIIDDYKRWLSCKQKIKIINID